MSGKRAKMRYFPYIKQNSIVEIVSTMESFFGAEVGFFIALQSRIVANLRFGTLNLLCSLLCSVSLVFRLTRSRRMVV